MPPARNIFRTPNAWTNRSIGGKDGLTHRFTPRQLAAFDTLLSRTRHLKPHEITRADFDHREAVRSLVIENHHRMHFECFGPRPRQWPGRPHHR